MAVKENKISVIICEFNPLHTGHKRLIDYAKSFSDYVVCVMSGNFTQRAMPACAEKHLRAVHAIKSGADLVIELPTPFAISSAENFALGGVMLAQKLGADFLVFGCECGDIKQIYNLSERLENKDIQSQIKIQMEGGASYPKAVALATKSQLLESPNNTLALEYVRTLKKLDSSIVPITLKREDNYNSDETGEYVSSSALRQVKHLRKKFTANYVENDMDDEVENTYKTFAVHALATKTAKDLTNIEGVTEGIENRIEKADKTADFNTMVEDVKTKRYTWLKIQRIILNTLLDLTKEKMETCKQHITTQVLAVSTKALPLLQLVEEQTDQTTVIADNLYASLSGKQAPKKFIKV